MRVSRWLFVLFLVLAAGAAVALVRGGGPRPVTVEVQAVSRRDVFRSYVTASGEIVASRYADVGSSVMGRVVELAVREGQVVRAGQLLARIDQVAAASDARAGAAQVAALRGEAQAVDARAREARLALERARALAAQGLLPPSDLDVAQAAASTAHAQAAAAADRVRQAEAQLGRARDAYGKTEISAPLAGTVTRLAVREGEMVVIGVQNQPGTILMTVSDLASINAEVKVAEADVLRVREGQPAEVTLEAVSRRVFPGKVVEVGASALPAAGTGAAAREFRVVIRLDAPDPGLRPGLTCDARILTSEAKDVLALPLQAVVLRPDPKGGERTAVFQVDGGRVRLVPVETGAIGGLDVEVRGVQDGARVVAGPFQALRELADGTRVREESAATP